jgi:hypothetical protein
MPEIDVRPDPARISAIGDLMGKVPGALSSLRDKLHS